MAHHKKDGYKCKGCRYYSVEYAPYLHAYVETCNDPKDSDMRKRNCYKPKEDTLDKLQ